MEERLTRPEYTTTAPTPADAAAIMRLRTAVWVEEALAAGISRPWVELHTLTWLSEEAVREYQEHIRACAADTMMYLQIATASDGEIMALLDAYETEESNYLAVIQLHPRARGTGLAGRMLEAYVAASNPEKPIALDVLQRNNHARRFYEKHGFREVPESLHYDLEVLPMITMRREAHI